MSPRSTGYSRSGRSSWINRMNGKNGEKVATGDQGAQGIQGDTVATD
jgi:hypothetical protein